MKKEIVYEQLESHYRANYDRFVARLRRNLNNKYNAEDVVQEAYCRAFKYWSTYDPDKEFDVWFKTVLNNSIKDFFKKEIMHGMSLDVIADDQAPVRMMKRLELKEAFALIEKQEERIRRILVLVLIEGYTSYEVEQVVPESANSIRKIIQRFRDSIR